MTRCGGRRCSRCVVSLALQVGVNYANDYSDGIRGTDAERVGPLRLVGSGLATPGPVKAAAFMAFGVAAVAGLALAATTAWWLVAVGRVCIVAAWFYTGGAQPYGYLGLGEVMVFVFFGLVAVLGTTYVQTEDVRARPALCARRAASVPGLRDPGRQQPARHPDRPRGRQDARWPCGSATARTRALYVLLVLAALVAARRRRARHHLVGAARRSPTPPLPAAAARRRTAGPSGRSWCRCCSRPGLAELVYGAGLFVAAVGGCGVGSRHVLVPRHPRGRRRPGLPIARDAAGQGAGSAPVADRTPPQPRKQ